MVNPLVAICIPTYEKIELFKRLEKSVLLQDYDNYIVIITDNSESDVLESYICESELSKKEGFVYIHNERQLGASGNTDKCVRLGIQSGAKYIKILYQDDFFSYSDSLSRMVDAIENEQKEIAFCGNYEVYDDHKTIHVLDDEDIDDIKRDVSSLFRANLLGAPSVVIFKNMDCNFDPNLKWLLDVDFYLQVLEKKDFMYISEPLIGIGHDGEQLTDYCVRHPLMIIREVIYVYKKNRWMHNAKNRKYVLLKVFELLLTDFKNRICR